MRGARPDDSRGGAVRGGATVAPGKGGHPFTMQTQNQDN